MRQYRVHLYHSPSIGVSPAHWAVSSEGDELIEVGDYDDAVEMATNLAGADAILSHEDVEVVVDSSEHSAARRILFSGDDAGLESSSEAEDVA